MTIKLIKRNFYIPESYVFKTNCQNSATNNFVTPYTFSSNYVGSLKPNYQQNKSSSPSVGIHKTDVSDNSLENKVK